MNTPAPLRLLTAEEFAALPQTEDGSQQELVEGVIVITPPHSTYVGMVCSAINTRLGAFVDRHDCGWVASICGVILARDPDTVRGPVVAVWKRERLPQPPPYYPAVAPELVVEVLPPSDLFLVSIHKKVEQYLTAGVRLIWILVPEDRSVTVIRTGARSDLLKNGETLTGEDVLPGFSCPVAELFP